MPSIDPEINPDNSGINELKFESDIETRLNKITRNVAEMLSADVCAITFLDSGKLVLKTAYSSLKEVTEKIIANTEIPANAPCLYVAQSQNHVMLNDIQNDENGKYAFLKEQFGYNSYVCVPIVTAKGKLLGTISCCSLQKGKFTQSNIEFLYLWSKWVAMELLENITDQEVITLQQKAIEANKQLKESTEHIKQTQKQMIQTEKLSAIGQLVAGIAHELNNPLTTIIGFSQLALEQNSPSKSIQYLNKIQKEAVRCERIVKQLLIFARKHIPEKTFININDIIADVIDLKSYEWKVNKIETSLKLDPKLPFTMADPFQIQQAIFNIAINAEQAIRGFTSAGCITIKTLAENDRIVIAISDNGPGIPKELHKTIFEPFYTTKPIGEGTGLGLSMCVDTIKDHNGEISVESEVGKGSTFVIKLPIVPKTETSEMRKKRKSERLNISVKGKKVLVIDDEIHITELIQAILTEMGITVSTAYDGQSGLQKIKKDRYDMVLCDIKMPVFSGMELHEEVVKIDPEMTRNMLYLTGDIFSKETQDFIKQTGVKTIQKPFELNEFKNMVISQLKTQ